MLFPFAYDVPMARWPWMNWLLMGLLVICFVWSEAAGTEPLRYIVGVDEMSDGEIHQHPLAFLGHMFLHAGVGHLVGNLVFMWVFGNAACAKLGQVGYLALWLGCGAVAGVAQPHGVGASGAIMGAVGFCLVCYPLNDISIFYSFFWFFLRVGVFRIAGYWVMLFYIACDLLGTLNRASHVGHVAHLSGLVVGAVWTAALVACSALESERHEATLFDLVRHRRSGPARRAEAGLARLRRAGMEGRDRLHVRLRSGAEKHLSVGEFLRHEAQGKPVDDLPVSEDGAAWTTFGQWRRARGV